jgi:F-type H+-transporting ATPase subunit a
VTEAITDNLMEHVLDHPWRLGGRAVPWMSSQITVMLLVGVGLAVVLPLLAGRRGGGRRGAAYQMVEMFVSFVRHRVAAPAMGRHGDPYVPYLATLLVFLLGCNLAGLVPLMELSSLLGLRDTPVGGTATGSIYVCAALAGTTFFMVTVGSYWQAVRRLWRGPGQDAAPRERAGLNLILAASNALQARRRSLPVAVAGGVVVWLNGLAPAVPGLAGLLLWPVLLGLEIIGYAAKCFALCIRLFANMAAGHLVLAVLLLMAAAGRGWALAYASLPSAVGVLAMMVLELLVAAIQAYIFTLLSAVFIALATNPPHEWESVP